MIYCIMVTVAGWIICCIGETFGYHQAIVYWVLTPPPPSTYPTSTATTGTPTGCNSLLTLDIREILAIILFCKILRKSFVSNINLNILFKFTWSRKTTSSAHEKLFLHLRRLLIHSSCNNWNFYSSELLQIAINSS